ncbi:hypothetical protein AB1278_08050 [Chryseobacterium sp. NRRL B-14798]|uniref:hypothetical protein n=1 Tax=Chryseobacterium sp. NRRL B-14798 TaxID=3162880 RepID=UPI003D1D3F38
MEKFSIGDLVSLKNHPYSIVYNSKIGANALLTPPIMVVTEILNSKKFDPDSEEIELLPGQLLCTYFNSRNSSFEKSWFKFDEIIKLQEKDNEQEQKENNEVKHQTTVDILSLKKDFKNKLVILLTADRELSKKKISWSKNKEEENYKTDSYLEFLPPVMTVIGIVENSNYLKNRRDSKDGSLQKDCSKYLLKCKWFNHIKQTFSEELFPYKIIQKVNFPNEILEEIKKGISNKTVFTLESKEKEIKLDNNIKIKKIIIFKEVIILNHIVKILYKDIFSNRILTDNLESLDVKSLESKLDELVEEKYPDSTKALYKKRDELQWNENKFYKIRYTDRNGRHTERYITNSKLETFDTEDEANVKFIIANCLLRQGEIRHFKLKNINERLEMKDDFDKSIKNSLYQKAPL